MNAVFVYGTLKQGECRAGLWPAEPSSVREAWVLGTLFDRADYPAMTEGGDRVLGQRWEFDETVMQRVLERLDQIEGANRIDGPQLYTRVTVETWSRDGDSLGGAYCYHYAGDPQLDGFTRMQPDREESFVSWAT